MLTRKNVATADTKGEENMKLALKEWRKARGITIAEMAGKLGVHPNTYQSWEENPGKISIENGIKIAAYIDVPFDDIIFTSESTKLGL